MTDPPVKPIYVRVLCLALLFGGLLLDLSTARGLVVAIIYNIPIALSGLALSRPLTLWITLLALGADIAAGYENTLLFASVDPLALLNRGFAALSFLLVGSLTLAFESASAQVNLLREHKAALERERALRRLLSDLSGNLRPDVLLQGAAVGLRKLLDADAAVIAALEEHRFAEPRYASPEASSVARSGSHASWAVDAVPLTGTPVITVRSDRGTATVGRWPDPGESLVVVLEHARVAEASHLLGEALLSLAPLLERARATLTADAAPGAPHS